MRVKREEPLQQDVLDDGWKHVDEVIYGWADPGKMLESGNGV